MTLTSQTGRSRCPMWSPGQVSVDVPVGPGMLVLVVCPGVPSACPGLPGLAFSDMALDPPRPTVPIPF